MRMKFNSYFLKWQKWPQKEKKRLVESLEKKSRKRILEIGGNSISKESFQIFNTCFNQISEFLNNERTFKNLSSSSEGQNNQEITKNHKPSQKILQK